MDFCTRRGKDPLSPTPTEVLTFLTELFQEGKGYSSLCVARSAISACCLNDSHSVGSHPWISRFLRGIFNQRPALPRTLVTWDADMVIDFLRQWSPAKCLSFSQLSLKVVMLCLLVTGQRGQTMWFMDIRNMSWSKKEVTCRIGDLIKTSAPGKHIQELVFPAFPPDRRICPVTYLQAYVKRSASLRGDETKLFVSWKAPHKGISRDTLRRWTRTCLIKAGIDMSIFAPHSTRAASTSKAVGHVPLKTILKTAGWRRRSTFAVYYHKPILPQGSFGEAVLRASSK